MSIAAAPRDDYAATPFLPDDVGRETMRKLWALYGATQFDAANKKVRSGSREERCAIAQLETAMIEAALPFQYYYHFEAWLGANHCESFMHYHPSYHLGDMTHSLRQIAERLKDIEHHLHENDSHLLHIYVEMSRLRKALGTGEISPPPDMPHAVK